MTEMTATVVVEMTVAAAAVVVVAAAEAVVPVPVVVEQRLELVERLSIFSRVFPFLPLADVFLTIMTEMGMKKQRTNRQQRRLLPQIHRE